VTTEPVSTEYGMSHVSPLLRDMGILGRSEVEGRNLRSREAAKQCSPRRKPWVSRVEDGISPEGAKEKPRKHIQA
jgi:hypothetical protein